MPSSSREEQVWPSSPKKEEVMTMVIFSLSSVESWRWAWRLLEKRTFAVLGLRARVCFLNLKE